MGSEVNRQRLLPRIALSIHATASNRKRCFDPPAAGLKTAARVFDDPNLILMHDRVIGGEQRWHAIGAVSSALLLVVHVYREDDVNGEEIIRIISAREADQRERRIYLQQAAQ